MYIGTKFKLFLCQKGMTQAHVVRNTSLKYNLVNAFFNGRAILRENEIKEICDLLDVDFKKAITSGEVVEKSKKKIILKKKSRKEVQQVMNF